MSDGMKAAGLGLLLGALAITFVVANHAHARAAVPGDRTHLVLVTRQSFCIALPAISKIRFRYVVRNAGEGAAATEATPWERFSDGTAASWVSDAIAVRIPAGGTRAFVRFVDYDAAAHDVTGCGVEWGDSSAVTRVRVRA